MKLLIKIGLLLLVSSVSIFVSCWESKQDRMVREAKEYTRKNCPQKLDDFTILDSMVFVKNEDGGECIYYHTVDCGNDTIDALIAKQDTMRTLLLNRLINTQELKKAKEEGCIFTYLFRWKRDSKVKFKFSFSKQEYR